LAPLLVSHCDTIETFLPQQFTHSARFDRSELEPTVGLQRPNDELC
jgi:hypothetical protein